MVQKSLSDKLNYAVTYIEENIYSKLTLAQIALVVELSPYHLHRVFKSMTAQKMMDYVRNRKLAHSIQMLLDTDFKLIDIAYQYGFSHEQSYIRAFCRAFNMTPTQFRKDRPQLEITDKINLKYLQSFGQGRLLMQPNIIFKPAFWVVGTKSYLHYNEDGFCNKVDRQGNSFFYDFRQKVCHAKAPHMYIGIIKYLPNSPDCREYITALEVSSTEDMPQGMVRQLIPAQKYAVFTYIGLHHPEDTTLKHVIEIYRYIFEVWLPQSGYTFGAMYQMEFIDSDIAGNDYCEIALYIPIGDKKPSSISMGWLAFE